MFTGRARRSGADDADGQCAGERWDEHAVGGPGDGRTDGDAAAEGSVKASYGQAASADEPVHVLAARAELKHDSEVATFHGVPGRPARLWQGASQVDAAGA